MVIRMDNSKVKQIVKILTPYLGMFPGNKMGGDSLTLYAKALADDYDPAEIQAAMLKLLKTARFFPRVSEICEAVESLRDYAKSQDSGRKHLTEGEAWEEAMKNVRLNHVYRPWKFSSKAVEQAVNQFGKMELILLKPEEMNTARAQFMRIYNGCANREAEENQNRQTLKKIGIVRGMNLEQVIHLLSEKKGMK